MSKKFVVALHGSPNLRDTITNYLLGKNWRVWHWYADFWLLSEVSDELTAGKLYQDMELDIPTIVHTSLLVIEMGPELRYFGRAPRADAWDWMRDHWGIADVPPPIPLLVPPPHEIVKNPSSNPDQTKAEN
jgi:hypothetical protein